MTSQTLAPRAFKALTIAIGTAGLLGSLSAGAAEGTRALQQKFPAGAGEIRIANLAGRVDLIPGSGSEVVIDATIHAEGSGAGETQKLLQGMSWARERDSKGRPQWVLTYPVNKYNAFAYPRVAYFQVRARVPRWPCVIDLRSDGTIARGCRCRLFSHRGRR